MEPRAIEWLETNGLGGYACGPVTGPATRRYHAWLVAAMQPPGGRLVLLSKADETLVTDGERYELGVNRFPQGVLHPRGDRYLIGFRRVPYPVWTYRCGDTVLEKRIYMVPGENTTVAEYTLLEGEGTLELRPLTAFRDYHHLTRESVDRVPALWIDGETVRLKVDELPGLILAHNARAVTSTGHWYRNFEYSTEQARGLDYQEDLYQPCVLEYSLREPAKLMASTQYRPLRDVPKPAQATSGLRHAATQFFARRDGGATVVAGYPWFTDWGRDTMIALPGLLAATGRLDDAREILAQFARFTNQGMLPNWFPEAGREPEYNTMDASLWFFEATQAYLDAGGDAAFVRNEVYPKLSEIVHWHLRGTRFGIRLDDDGMITGGADGVQLTWMDARVGDWVVTPRRGKPVEIQALWYNALRVLEDLARRFDDGVTKLRAMELADLCARHFEPLFWNEAAGCLFDVIQPDGMGDPAVRPNQVLAAGLRHPLLLGLRARQVVDCVERQLLTPYGLRTLAPKDLRYRPRYEGGVEARDSAYHQGTAWPWLLGPFIDAYLRAYPSGQAQAIAWLQPLADHLEREGQLPEIADGDAPQRPAGCFAQAWSVAEVARVGAKLGLDDRLRPSAS